MSIASQLTALEGNISDAYDMVAQRGGTVPARKNMENLDDAIATIPSGGSFVGIPREVSAQGVYQAPSNSFTFSLPSSATDIGSRGLYYAFYYCTSLTSVDLSSLTTVSGANALDDAFSDCSSLSSADLSSLTTVSGSASFNYAFQRCSSLSSVNLSSLTTARGSTAFYGAFRNCTLLTSVDLSSLTTVSVGSNIFTNTFWGCTSLASVNLSSLSVMSSYQCFTYAFRDCTSLTSLSFPSLTTTSFGNYTNQFDYMLYGCTGVTVHFPSAIQATIGSWASVQNGFGGTNTTVLFDL